MFNIEDFLIQTWEEDVNLLSNWLNYRIRIDEPYQLYVSFFMKLK